MAQKLDEYTKAAILLAVRGGTMSRAVARERHALSDDEFRLWELAFAEDGMVGLRDRRLSARRRSHSEAVQGSLVEGKTRTGSNRGGLSEHVATS